VFVLTSEFSIVFDGAEDDIVAVAKGAWSGKNEGEEECGRITEVLCSEVPLGAPSLYKLISSGREDEISRRRGVLLMFRSVKVRTVGEFIITESKSRHGIENGVSR